MSGVSGITYQNLSDTYGSKINIDKNRGTVEKADDFMTNFQNAVQKEKKPSQNDELFLSNFIKEYDVPYGYLADDKGIINYNGVKFICDSKENAICLGDMTDTDNVLTIQLENGGSLKLNTNNIKELSKAISMFSPEDQKRILQAISTDNHCKKKIMEIEEDKSKIGEKITSMDDK